MGGRPRGGRGTLLKIILIKICQMHYFGVFFQEFQKLFVNFTSGRTKNTKCRGNVRGFDENAIERLNFLQFLEKVLLEIEPPEIT